MCNPMLALAGVGMALSAAGTLTASQGQAQARDASTAAINAETARQAQHQAVEKQLFENSMAQSQPDIVKANAVDATGKRMSELTAAGGVKGVDLLPGQAGDASSATKAAIAQNSDAATAQLQREAQGRAGLGGLNDAFRTLATGIQPNADRIGLEANAGAGDAALLPLQLSAASRQGGGMRTLGSLFTGLGSAAVAGSQAGGGEAIADLFKGGGMASLATPEAGLMAGAQFIS